MMKKLKPSITASFKTKRGALGNWIRRLVLLKPYIDMNAELRKKAKKMIFKKTLIN